MQPAAEVILEAALKLPESERLTIVSRLLETMPAEDSSASLDDPSLIEELDRRFADREGSVTWPELQARELMPASQVLFHRLATREYRSARDSYRQRSIEVEQRFVVAVDRAVSRIVTDAESLPALARAYRYVRVARFPDVLGRSSCR